MLTGPTITTQDAREISSVKNMDLGTLAYTADGRKYRYARAGAVALTAGTMNEQSAIVANHSNVVVQNTAAIGNTEVRATLGATLATKDQYADGYMLVNDGPGEGIMYAVEGHAAVASAGVITVTLKEPLVVALTTASRVTFIKNPYDGVIIVPSAATANGVPAGVSNVAVTAAFYGWLQTSGYCAMLCGATAFTLGEEVSQGVSLVAGSGSVQLAAAPNYGVAAQLGVNTEYQVVKLTLE